MAHPWVMTKGRTLRNTAVVVATATFLCACGAAESGERVGGEAPAMAVDCAPYNVGSPDHVAGSGEIVDPLDLAERWAAGAGRGGSEPRLASRDSTEAFVVFDSPAGAREAVLHYQDDGDGWYLEGLVYC